MGSSTIDARVLAPENQGSTGPWQAALVRAIERLIVWIRNERRIRREIDELMALDDRLLCDIGLSREHIEYAARYGCLPEGLERRVSR
jgi:uncharacterized protein YjiS (DUF1127 family)